MAYNIECLTYNIYYLINKRLYPKKVLNKPFSKVYYNEFPTRIRGLPNEIRDFPLKIHANSVKTRAHR